MNTQTPEIPPTPEIREKLGDLVREASRQRKLLRLAQQRDKLLSQARESDTGEVVTC